MKNNYYAIKIGNNVKDLIVDSWDKCKKHVIDYPSVYKGFKTYKKEKKYLTRFISNDILVVLPKKRERKRDKKSRMIFEN